MHIRLHEEKLDDAIRIATRKSDPGTLSEDTKQFLQELIERRQQEFLPLIDEQWPNFDKRDTGVLESMFASGLMKTILQTDYNAEAYEEVFKTYAKEKLPRALMPELAFKIIHFE